MGLYSGGLIIEMTFASEIWGAYFQEGLFFWGGWGGGLITGILRYLINYANLETCQILMLHGVSQEDIHLSNHNSSIVSSFISNLEFFISRILEAHLALFNLFLFKQA